MLLKIAVTAALGVIIFLIGEHFRRRLHQGNETSRKLIHTIHGLTVISWIFIANHAFIIGFEIFFFVMMFVFKRITRSNPRFLGWVYQVGRNSWGEFFYPLGIIIAVVISQSDWFLVAGILLLAVADSVAALVGKAYGKGNEYKVFGGTKSLTGTGAFVITAAGIFLAILCPSQVITGEALILAVVALPLVLAGLENVSMRGSDNLVLPVATVLLLNLCNQIVM